MHTVSRDTTYYQQISALLPRRCNCRMGPKLGRWETKQGQPRQPICISHQIHLSTRHLSRNLIYPFCISSLEKYLNCIWINGHPGWKNATVHPNDKQSVGVSIVWWMSSLVGLNNCWRSDSGFEKMLWIGAFIGQHMDSYGSFLFFPIWMRCRSNAGYPGELFSIWLPLPLCAPWNADKFS
jgi:hypothetical protein